ncbi:MAG: hypothetical protein R6W90_13845 [Ignavibacteriaceae bacterium]
MKNIVTLFILLLIPYFNSFPGSEDTICVAHYNVENLFDTIDDPIKQDEEFLPGGSKQWTDDKLDQKFFNLARVIRTANNYKGPDILGVCEVEHKHLIDTLITGYLKDKYYKTAYAESPDNRGIDNGLIYNADKFTLLSVHDDTVHLSDGYPTRGILNVKLLYKQEDTVYVFVNHWPSRRGGAEESEKNRIAAAETLKNRVTKILESNPDAKILIIGDFNDEPNNKSISETLGAVPLNCSSPDNEENDSSSLFNTSFSLFEKGEGSYKYQEDWNMLDQIIISRAFISGNFRYECNSFGIFKPDFLLTKSGKYEGTSVPTYGGSNYLGGYSDHFMVTAKFIINK